MGKIPLPQQDTSGTALSDMEKLVGVQHKNKSPKRASKASGGGGNKKKGVKVVYISNPMRVTTSAAAFPSLVQRLTGRDSNVADMHLPPYSSSPDEASVASTTGSGSVRCSYDFGGGDPLDHGANNNCGSGGVDSYVNSGTATPFGAFDEAFGAPQQLSMDSFPGFMSSTAAVAGLYYEPQAVGLRSFADM